MVNSGTFNNNGFNLPIGDGDMIIAAEAGAGEGVSTVLLPRDDGHFGVYAKPMTVPGGVLGIDLPFNNLFGLAGVTAEVQAVGVPVFNDLITNMDISLPVRMKINNAFLGNNCYLGSETAPVNFHLTPTADSSPAFEVAPVGLVEGQPGQECDNRFRYSVCQWLWPVRSVESDRQLARQGAGNFGYVAQYGVHGIPVPGRYRRI
ncbi:hypothetical protein [Rhodococcus sp. ACPA4]|uniref:hypothetical protein n=1 Tax=Rhodococcus sp. ACPA4 TaxID=2028571 RepID=UPI00211B7E82|nr:hypothetical protein [Rhodococcus sp. ACPA4]